MKLKFNFNNKVQKIKNLEIFEEERENKSKDRASLVGQGYKNPDNSIFNRSSKNQVGIKANRNFLISQARIE